MRIVQTAILAAVLSLAAPAATVVNFDDLPDDPFGAAVPAGYGGLNWGVDFGVWDSSSSAIYPPHSFNNVLLGNRLNQSGYAAMPVYFVTPGAEFLGAWFSGSGTALFDMYFSGNLVATSSSLNLNSTSTYLASGYSGPVDEVRLTADRGQFVMDDFTYNPAGTAVPEPGTALLMGLGLAAVSMLSRRRA